MNCIDSSGWLEYFADGKKADFFAPAIEEPKKLIVSSINLYEVFKRIFQQRGEDAALQAIALMSQSSVIPVDDAIALSAAKIRIEHKLPMADSIILATARRHHAVLWTGDADFKGLEGVRYTP